MCLRQQGGTHDTWGAYSSCVNVYMLYMYIYIYIYGVAGTPAAGGRRTPVDGGRAGTPATGDIHICLHYGRGKTRREPHREGK
jgi:hypothetical protein